MLARASAGRSPAPLVDEQVEAVGGDVLSDVLRAVRLTGALFFFVEAGSPWVAEAPCAAKFARVLLPRAQHVVSYHLIMEGSCYCELEGQAPLELSAGDGIVIPHGDRYALSSAPGMLGTYPEEVLIDWFRQMAAREVPDAFRVREGHGEKASLRVLCGFLGCDAVPFNPVLSRLPKALHLRQAASREHEGLAHLIALASREVTERRAGSECVLLKISELMFVEVVRCHLTALPSGETGWLAGLADPVVGRALALLHERPAHAWTVEELARRAGSSRSALAERFSELVGQSPIAYLASWRMQLAATLLVEGRAKVSAVATQVGYDSEAAFSRAFKAAAGQSPAAWRKAQG